MVAPRKMPAGKAVISSNCKAKGYTTMAIVERTVTPTTTRRVNRSFSFVFGRTEATAKAAEAPQIPTDPPAINPKSGDSFKSLAKKNPKATVAATANITINPVFKPIAPISANVIRIPRNATPKRRTVLAQKSIPDFTASLRYKKWSDKPISNAYNNWGPP